MPRRCDFVSPEGKPCSAHPMRAEARCFLHHPDHAQEAAEARRLGGQRRRREGTLAGAYDFDGLASVDGIRRLLEIAGLDALGLENSIARVRALVAIAMAATRLLETGELEQRLDGLEQAVHGQTALAESVFDVEVEEDQFHFLEPEPLPAEPEPGADTDEQQEEPEP